MDRSGNGLPALGLCVLMMLGCSGLVSSCASSPDTHLPASEYANRPANWSEMAADIAYGPMDRRFEQLQEGMSKEEVIRILLAPDKTELRAEGESTTETLHYLGRLMKHNAWDRADYQVHLRDEKVVAFYHGSVFAQPPPRTSGAAGWNFGIFRWYRF